MTHTDLIARLRESCYIAYDDGSNDYASAGDAADALTAAQERIEMAECAGFSAGYEAGQKDAQERIEALEGALEDAEQTLMLLGDDGCRLRIRASLDATGKGDGDDASQNTAQEYAND